MTRMLSRGHLRHERSSTGGRDLLDDDGSIQQLVRAMDRQLWEVAVQIAVVGSYLNRLTGLESCSDRMAILQWIPADPTNLPMMAERLTEELGLSDPAPYFEYLLKAVLHGKILLKEAVRNACSPPADRHRDELIALWQTAANAALLCLHERDRLAADGPLPELVRPAAPLVAALVAVRDGEAPLGLEKDSVVPEWARSRSHTRVFLHDSATLHVSGLVRHVRVIDVSRGGMGIDFAHDLHVNQLVAVMLNSGRRLLGRVAWCRSGRAGIEFASELAPTDPLLASN